MDVLIPGLAPGKNYDIAVSYRHRGNYSPRQTLTATTPDVLEATNAAAIDGQGALATLSAVGVAQITAPSPGNLLYAPTFEDAAAWTLGSGVSYATDADTTATLKTPKSVQAAGNGTTSQGDSNAYHVAGAYLPCSPGDVLFFSYRALKKAGFTGQLEIRIDFYRQDKATAADIAALTPALGGDHKTSALGADAVETIAGVVVVPGSTSFARFRIRCIWSTTLNNGGSFRAGAPSAFRTAQTGQMLVDNAGAALTQAAVKTSEGTAAAIAGQGSLATMTPPSYSGNSGAIAGGLVAGQTFIDTADANKLKTVMGQGGGLTVTLDRYSQNKTRSGAGTVTSDAYASTVTGGSGSYEYTWTQYYGPALTSMSAETGSSNTFTYTLGVGDSFLARIRLDVRDTTNNTFASVLCTFRGTETA